MRVFYLTFLALILFANLFAQKEKYSSKEKDEYYNNNKAIYSPFTPIEKEVILKFKPKYYEIKDSEIEYEHYSEERYSRLRTSGIPTQYVGKIDKAKILKYEKKDSIVAFIYKYSAFENIFFGESGIWIGYSENNGKDWSYYYTGIVEKQPVFLKWYSKRPLIKEKGKLEIDACLLQQLSPFSHPVSTHSYECVKDGIYIVFDINTLAKDSDNDGLTDIVEEKLYTDKNNRDTDGDGILDNIDTNPRKYYPRTEKTKIYEALLNEAINWKNKRWIGELLLKEDNYYVTDSTETVLIITDNEDLMGIQPKNYRVIFMTTDEYSKITKVYDTELNEMSISPLFKVDNRKNTYRMSDNFNTWGSSYLIKKKKRSWTIQLLSYWIS